MGPLNKSLFTQELELVTKCLLQVFETALVYTTHDTPKPELHVTFDDIDINMSSLYKKANFSHLQLDAKDSDNYISKIDAHISYGAGDHFIKNAINVSVMDAFTPAEIKAIRDYTGTAYVDINSILYGNSKWVWSLKEAIIEGVFVASGINKITPSIEDVYTYRGESSISDEQLQHRIELVNQGGGVTHEPAFMSTSVDYKVAMNFLGFGENNKSMIIFDACGKNISNLSCFSSEQEFLLGPSTVLWNGYEFKEGIHFFHARVVSPLETQEEPTGEDCHVFSKLLNWASDHGISTDFITPFVKNQVEKGGLDPQGAVAPENPSDMISNTPFIEHEKNDWLACIDEILAHHHSIMRLHNEFNEMFSEKSIHLDDVITRDTNEIIETPFKDRIPQMPMDNGTSDVSVIPIVPLLEIPSVENLMT